MEATIKRELSARWQPMHYATPPMTIGKHEWRCVVVDYDKAERCTVYEWRSPRWDGERWNDQRDWPTWDGNDTYLGMPKSLSRLWRKHESEIRAALNPA